ncbi:MAG: hypothetical protein C0490_05515 [Marivirga sp.]|nr:hypothetical protein [Marivirga sp.]
MKTHFKYPLVKIPTDIQFTLYLIREEIKSRKMFRALHEARIGDCYFQPHLDSLILESLGLDDGNDKIFSIYDHIVEKRSRKIEADYDSIMNQAFKVYQELINEKKKRSEKRK